VLGRDARELRFLKDHSDNGADLASNTVFFLSEEAEVTLGFVQPGKPTQSRWWAL